MPGTYWSVGDYDLKHYDSYHNYYVNVVDTGSFCGVNEVMQTLHVCKPTISAVSVCLNRRDAHICTEMPDKLRKFGDPR